ncbi:integrase core domain-containing protein [Bowmanella pacifica]
MIPFIKSRNRSFYNKYFNWPWLESLPDAKLKIKAWRDDYKKSRPL